MKDKFCTKCGNKLEDIDKFCGKCGEPVPGAQTQTVDGNVQQVPVNPKNIPISPEDNKKANLLTLLCLGLNALVPVLIYLFNLIGIDYKIIEPFLGALPMASLAILIYVRVKYPKNIFSKVVLILYIVGFIIGIILLIVLIVSCYVGCGELIRSCN